MVMQLEPPARTSVTALVVLKGGGVNHWVMSSGVVQQRYSFSRDAFSTRLMTSSRSVGEEASFTGDMGGELMILRLFIITTNDQSEFGQQCGKALACW